jgi:hypothetical protein
MDTDRKTCDIRTWKKHLSFDISSTNIHTLVPPPYQCVVTHRIQVFRLLSQPLSYLVGHHLRLSNALDRILNPDLKCSTRHFPTINRKHFYEYPLHGVILPTAIVQENTALRQYTPHTRSPFWVQKPASEHAHARLLRRLSWSWTVLLASDAHKEPITSITAVLLPFVYCLLTLPRN